MNTAKSEELVRHRPSPKGAKAKAKIHTVLSEFKEGTLKSGGSGKTVTDKKQAVAIALSEARAAGKKRAA